jgi:two-component system capsular synthesis response regulator RcsB
MDCDRRVRVVIADDHPVVLLGFRAVLDERSGIEVIAETMSSSELIPLLATHCCDVLVTDFSMPKGVYGEGLSYIKYLRRSFPKLPIVVVTMITNAALLQSIVSAGVLGVLDKGSSIERLPNAIHAAAARRPWLSPLIATLLTAIVVPTTPAERDALLTPREAEVFRLLAQGMSVTQISEHVHRSYKTVSQQKNDGMRRLGLRTDMELLKYLHEHGFYG